MEAESETLSVRDVAIALGCTLKWVYDLIYTGRLAAIKVDGVWKVSRSAVEVYANERALSVLAKN